MTTELPSSQEGEVPDDPFESVTEPRQGTIPGLGEQDTPPRAVWPPTASFFWNPWQEHPWITGAITLVALGLVIIVGVVFLPRPVLHIDQVDFVTTACDTASHSRQVTALMTIRNTGSAPGVAAVHLLIDGGIASTGSYYVPASEGIQEGLRAILMDCQWHRFAVELFDWTWAS
jgi:hypothetical protein